MATHEKVGNLARAFHDQLSKVVVASLVFLKGYKPERGLGLPRAGGHLYMSGET